MIKPQYSVVSQAFIYSAFFNYNTKVAFGDMCLINSNQQTRLGYFVRGSSTT